MIEFFGISSKRVGFIRTLLYNFFSMKIPDGVNVIMAKLMVFLIKNCKVLRKKLFYDIKYIYFLISYKESKIWGLEKNKRKHLMHL